MSDVDLFMDFGGPAALLGMVAIGLGLVEWIRRNIEKSRKEKALLASIENIENMDTRALWEIVRELKEIRGSLHTIEVVYGIILFSMVMAILAGTRKIL